MSRKPLDGSFVFFFQHEQRSTLHVVGGKAKKKKKKKIKKAKSPGANTVKIDAYIHI